MFFAQLVGARPDLRIAPAPPGVFELVLPFFKGAPPPRILTDSTLFHALVGHKNPGALDPHTRDTTQTVRRITRRGSSMPKPRNRQRNNAYDCAAQKCAAHRRVAGLPGKCQVSAR